MNFLVYLLFFCEGEELMVGNFFGDFVKNWEFVDFFLGI